MGQLRPRRLCRPRVRARAQHGCCVSGATGPARPAGWRGGGPASPPSCGCLGPPTHRAQLGPGRPGLCRAPARRTAVPRPGQAGVGEGRVQDTSPLGACLARSAQKHRRVVSGDRDRQLPAARGGARPGSPHTEPRPHTHTRSPTRTRSPARAQESGPVGTHPAPWCVHGGHRGAPTAAPPRAASCTADPVPQHQPQRPDDPPGNMSESGHQPLTGPCAWKPHV